MTNRASAKLLKRITTNTYNNPRSLTQTGTAINFHARVNSSRRLRTFLASKSGSPLVGSTAYEARRDRVQARGLAFRLSLNNAGASSRQIGNLDKSKAATYRDIPSVLVEHCYGY